MTTRLLLTFAAVSLWGGKVEAQTDVTSTYIANPSFELCEVYNSDNVAEANKTTGSCVDYTSTGWTPQRTAANSCAAAFVYGSANTINNSYTAPATAPTGGGNIAMGFSAGWSQYATYETAYDVILPAGTYTLSADVYNANASTDATGGSCLGFTTASGTIPTTYKSTKIRYTVSDWSTDEVTFTLTEATTGRFVVGMRGGNTTSPNTAVLFFDNLKLTYTAPTAIPTAQWASVPSDGLQAYLYNVGSEKFLYQGSSYGTHAVGQPHKALATTLSTSGEGYKIITDVNTTGTFVTGDAYVDGNETRTEGWQWQFEEVDATNHIYRIKLLNGTNEGQYLFKDPWGIEVLVGNLTGTNAEPYPDLYYWQLVTPDDYVNLRYYASSTNPVDMTLSNYITNPQFDDNADGWTFPSVGNNGRTATTLDTWYTNPIAESWNSGDGSVSQTITGLPAGKYRIRVQGSYSDGPLATAVDNANNGTEARNAVLYGNDAYVAIKHVLDETTVQTVPNVETWGAEVIVDGNTYKVPNHVNEFSYAFTAGYYDNTLDNVIVGLDGNLTLEIRKDVSVASDWLVFDNFRLYYLGPDLSSYASSLSALVSDVQAEYANFDASVLTALQTVVDANDGDGESFTTAEDYETAISNIYAALTTARKQQMDLNATAAAAEQTALAAQRYNELIRFESELSNIAAGTEKTALEAVFTTENTAGYTHTSASEYDLASQAIYDAAVAALSSRSADINVSPLFMPNYSFERGDLTYWEYNVADETQTGIMESTGIYATAGIDGTYQFNTWANNTDNKYVQRTVTGLPEGTYQLTVSAASNNDYTIDVTLGNYTTTATTTAGGATFMDVSSPIVPLADNGSLLVKADNNTWFKVDNFRLILKADDIEHYTYVADQDNWASCDEVRVEQDNITYDTTNGTISLVPSTTSYDGLNNVSVCLYGSYYIEPEEKYFYVKASNTLAEHSKSYLWWLGGQLLGNTEPTQTARDDDYTYYLWDLTDKNGYYSDSRSVIASPAYTYSVDFGVTQEDTSNPSVIHDIEFLESIPSVFTQWTTAKNVLGELIANADTVLARMDDTDGTFADAIAHAQEVYDGPETTIAQFTAELTAVRNAFNTALADETKVIEVTEMTIINPSFEYDNEATNAPTGWTVASTDGDTGVKVGNNGGTYGTIYINGTWLYNTWDGDAVGYGISQTLTGLPNGDYKLQAKLAGLTTNTLTLAAGAETVEWQPSSVATFDQVKTDKVTVSDGTLEIGVTSEAGWYKADQFQLFWYPENDDTDETPGTTPFTGAALVDGGTYYLYNPAANAFLCGNNDSGTHVSVNDVGIPVTLIEQTDGTYRLSTSPTYTGLYIGLNDEQTSTWVDTRDAYPNNIKWTVTPSATDPTQVTLKWDESYLTWDGESNTSMAELVYGAVTEGAYWQLVTKAERVAKIGTGTTDAEKELYNNASFYMINPDFSRVAVISNDYWNGAEVDGNAANTNGQVYNNTFDINQNVGTLLQGGIYRLEMQGFYRNGDYAANGYGINMAATRRHRGMEALLASVYATVSDDEETPTTTTFSVPLRSIFGDSIGIAGGKTSPEGWVAGTTHVDAVIYNTLNKIMDYGRIPNYQTHVSNFFDAGFYGENVLYVYVPAGNSLTLGVKKDVTQANDWTDFDHFRLYYMGGGSADLAQSLNNYRTVKAKAMRFVNNDYTNRELRNTLYMNYYMQTYHSSDADYSANTDYGTDMLKKHLTDYISDQADTLQTALESYEEGNTTAAALTALLQEEANKLMVETERMYLRYAISEFHAFHEGIRQLYKADYVAYDPSTFTTTYRTPFKNGLKQADAMKAFAVAALNNAAAGSTVNDGSAANTATIIENCRKAMYAIFGTYSQRGKAWNWFDMNYEAPDSLDYDDSNITTPVTGYSFSFFDPDTETTATTTADLTYSYDGTDITYRGLENYLRKLALDYVEHCEPATNNNFNLTQFFTKPEINGIEVWSEPISYMWHSDVNTDGVVTTNGSAANNFNIHAGNQYYNGEYPSFAERYHVTLDNGFALYQQVHLTPGRYRFNTLAFGDNASYQPAGNVYIAAALHSSGSSEVRARLRSASSTPNFMAKVTTADFSRNSLFFNVSEEGDYDIGLYISGDDSPAIWVGLRELELYKVPEARLRQDRTYIPHYVGKTGLKDHTETEAYYFNFASEADIYYYRTFPKYKHSTTDWTGSGWTITKVYDTDSESDTYGKVTRVRVTDTSGNTSGSDYEAAIAAFNEDYQNYWTTICLPCNMKPEQVKFVFGDNAVVNWFTGSEVQLFGDDSNEDDDDDGAIVYLNFEDPGLADNSDSPLIKANYPCLLMVGVDPDDLPYDDTDAANGKVGKWFSETNITAKRISSYNLTFATPEAAIADYCPYYLGTVRTDGFTTSDLGSAPYENVTAHTGGVAYNPDGGDFSFVGIYDGNGTKDVSGNPASFTIEDGGPFFEIPQPDRTNSEEMTASYYLANATEDSGTESYFSDTRLRYVPDDVSQKMFGTRAYFEYKGSSTAVANGDIRMRMEKNGLTTAVYDLRADGTMEKLDDGVKTGVYNIQGQLISKDSSVVSTLPKGVYIVNGKKVMVK